MKRYWLIVYRMSSDGTADEVEKFHGTLEQAIAKSTTERRHLDYGRNGCEIYPIDYDPTFFAYR